MEEKVQYVCEQCGAEQEVEAGALAPTCEACGIEMVRKIEEETDDDTEETDLDEGDVLEEDDDDEDESWEDEDDYE